ncbi:MAG: hypothetical protein AAB484_03425 [Patescibacteria group bacterium]
MNKKGFFIVIVIIILVVIGYMVLRGGDSVVTNNDTDKVTETDEDKISRDDFATTDKDSTDANLLIRLQSVSVSANESDSRIALSNGRAQFTSDNVKGTILLGDVAVEKTINGVKYVLATLAVNSGGSGTFQYVVLFEDKDGNLTDKSYSLVGDRVNITGLRADDVTGVSGGSGLLVSVSYLDHDKGEPLSAQPSVPRTKILVVENDMFNSAKEINL